MRFSSLEKPLPSELPLPTKNYIVSRSFKFEKTEKDYQFQTK